MSPFLIYTINNVFFKEPFYPISKDDTSEMDEFLYPVQTKQRNIKEHNFFSIELHLKFYLDNKKPFSTTTSTLSKFFSSEGIA